MGFKVTYAGEAGAADVSYELEPIAGTALDQADFTKVTEYAQANKLTKEQAAAVLNHREEAAAGVRTRLTPAKAPDKYTFSLGENSPLTQQDVEKIAANARTRGLSQETFTELLNQHVALATELRERADTKHAEERSAWVDQVKTDKTIGGDKLVTTLKHAKRAMDKFAPEGNAFRTWLDESGYGNHPLFVGFVAAIGKAMGEDPTLLGGAGGGGGKKLQDMTLADALYETDKKSA